MTNIWDNFAGTAQKNENTGKSDTRPLQQIFMCLDKGVIAVKKISPNYTICLCGVADMEESDLCAKLEFVAEELSGSLQAESA